MKDLIEYIAKSLVDDVAAVSVSQKKDRGVLVYTLTVADDETGRIIGKDGKVANAIRVLLRTASANNGDHVALKII
ncbi:MAG: KH domain-containing protein [Chloroflexi bacterium]|nr:KH domain-containing protein [Chloroflexota bacterium]MCL5273680.1 KH domain-containing protein [Chloroflexota bacterium]